MEEPRILSAATGQVLTLTLNRPAKLNCIDWQMLEELEERVGLAESDPEVRLLLFRGAGDRAFSTGADLKIFEALDVAETVRWIRKGQNLFDRIESMPKPTVAVIHGYAYGGGLELALSCDFRIATPEARFCFPEIQHGWVPGWGGMARLARFIGPSRAKELILLGESVGADRALEIGLLTWLVESRELEMFLQLQCEKLAQIEPILFASARSAIRGDTASEFELLSTLYSKSSR